MKAGYAPQSKKKYEECDKKISTLTNQFIKNDPPLTHAEILIRTSQNYQMNPSILTLLIFVYFRQDSVGNISFHYILFFFTVMKI